MRKTRIVARSELQSTTARAILDKIVLTPSERHRLYLEYDLSISKALTSQLETEIKKRKKINDIVQKLAFVFSIKGEIRDKDKHTSFKYTQPAYLLGAI